MKQTEKDNSSDDRVHIETLRIWEGYFEVKLG